MRQNITHLRLASAITFLLCLSVELAYPATHLFRSVGTDGDLNVQRRTVEIAGRSAKFSGPVPARWGVGDVLQYAVEGKPHLALIASRKSATVFTLQSSTGGPPRAAPAGTRLHLFRAYTSLAAWARRDENDAFDDAVEDFDDLGDLMAAKAIMNVACYADRIDRGRVVIDGWQGDAEHYIRVFTPLAAGQDGTSQRHAGVP